MATQDADMQGNVAKILQGIGAITHSLGFTEREKIIATSMFIGGMVNGMFAMKYKDLPAEEYQHLIEDVANKMRKDGRPAELGKGAL